MNTSNKALIVIDLQNDYFPGGAFPLWNTDGTLTNVLEAITQARSAGVPVILVQHVADSSKGIAPFFNSGTQGVELHPAILAAAKNANMMIKTFADSFLGTDLEEVLDGYGTRELFVCGMMTQNCVTHTAISKAAERYEVTVLADCCTTVSEMIHLIALNALAPRVRVATMDQGF
ncbi:MAG: cysteine hydrolase [Deltaproteobacteria bacterium HGW-Deltaproteobacteria-18]|jgi:nicotinamidase-related amidase|nr:MAG: cysteine hydrolase [Deltaproteobacteria bacterium HGW-Deltaproteobacteria-18]